MDENKTIDTTPNFDTDSSAKEVVSLYLDDIIPNRFQPRERFDETALRELAASIKEHGVIQPIIVRRIGEKYEIIAGERRYKASAMAGLTKIPAIVRNLDDKESSKVALLENLQRKNLSAIEEARTYQKILDLDEMTQFELAKTMGKSQPAVANKLRLLSLPDEVQDALLKEKISERHARSLLNLDNEQDQIEMLHKIIDNRMTVRDLDREIKTKNNLLQGLEGDISSPKKDISSFTASSGLNFDSLQPTPLNKIDDEQEDKDKTHEYSIDSLLNLDATEKQTSEKEEDTVQEILTPQKEEYPTIDLDFTTSENNDDNSSDMNINVPEEATNETPQSEESQPEILLDIPTLENKEPVEQLDVSDSESSKDKAIE